MYSILTHAHTHTHTHTHTLTPRTPSAKTKQSFDDTVRKYLKKDEHIVLAVLGVYAGAFGLFKLKSALTSKPVPAPAAAAAPSTSAIGADGFVWPTEATFDEWEKHPKNWAKFEEWVNSPAFDTWAESK